MQKEDMLKLLTAGIMAPSADNMQPWKFRIGDDSLEISLDQEQLGHFFDPAEVATAMGCGALIENIDHCARQMGLQMDLNRRVEADQKIVATLSFSPLIPGKQGGDLSDAVFSRCTDRALYDRRKTIAASDKKLLEDSVNQAENYTLTLYDNPEQRKKIIKTVYGADTIRFSHEKVHRDFYHVLRFGDAAERTREGLAQSTLGIEFFFIPVLKALRSWKITHFLNRVAGLHHMMALRGVWLPMVFSSSLVSITYRGAADYLQFGRVMERFWLQATAAGLSVQPLGAFPLFLARVKTVDGEGFSEREIARLNNLEQLFASATPGYQTGTDQLVMLFRLGYAKRPPNRSLRRPLDSFLI